MYIKQYKLPKLIKFECSNKTNRLPKTKNS